MSNENIGVKCEKCKEEIDEFKQAVIVVEDSIDGFRNMLVENWSNEQKIQYIEDATVYHSRHYPKIERLSSKPDIDKGNWIITSILSVFAAFVVLPFIGIASNIIINFIQIYTYAILIGVVIASLMVLIDALRLLRWLVMTPAETKEVKQ